MSEELHLVVWGDSTTECYGQMDQPGGGAMKITAAELAVLFDHWRSSIERERAMERQTILRENVRPHLSDPTTGQLDTIADYPPSAVKWTDMR